MRVETKGALSLAASYNLLFKTPDHCPNKVFTT